MSDMDVLDCRLFSKQYIDQHHIRQFHNSIIEKITLNEMHVS